MSIDIDHPRRRVLMVSSNGGHLTQLLALRDWWEGEDTHWVTFRRPDAEAALAGRSVIWAHHPTTRSAVNAVKNLVLAFRTLRRLRPDVIVSTGAGVAAPFFVAGAVLGIHRVYIEVIDRIDSPTLTGRICYHLSDAFCVQWEQQEDIYPGAVTIGRTL